MRPWVIGLSALALGGCTTTVSEPGQAVPESNVVPPVACDAARVEAYVGRNGTAVAEEARTAAGARSVRVIAPGQAVTMDFRRDRLNIETDASGTVVRVSCG
ncbi:MULTISPECIES: I78 family peptidase inhibitor [unclassified Sphingomonas]|uniref:I78 family peptidase inhibitor n=1 Tax=unclassified Sphingomonas TaxID=196159 RepID=UPI0006F81BE4|nr:MULTISPECIES: I78 family peptidase inhibitor [unclassified Sphingomonas]KQX19061.1 hypothetical protein ASD17_10850 [Sphingomonas sp. Root1294]KQY65262.1 hypothetical protein ASD39_14045 [Sphingomonas sp. Root50]KRB95444.1 hypothetical protein ASE22_06010 [Sphingomonas sp. Root720]